MRVYLTVAYYLTFVYSVANLFLWVQQKPSFEVLTSDERGGLVVATVFVLLVFIGVSEVYERHQGLRADFLDHILGRK